MTSTAMSRLEPTSTTLPVAVGRAFASISLSHFREYPGSAAPARSCRRMSRGSRGVTPWLKVAHIAEAFSPCRGLPAFSFLMELHVGLVCAAPAAKWVEYIPQLDALVESGMRIENGRAIPSDAPGLGIAWDWMRSTVCASMA